MERGWLRKNPASGLRPPKETHLPTLPFSKEEWEKILWAIDLFTSRGRYGESKRKRLRAFLLTLQHTGLRIRDVVCLRTDAVEGGKIFLYSQKTGVPVRLPLRPECLEALDQIKTPGMQYFFWTGNGKPKTAVWHWQRALGILFGLAGVKDGHAHRFRDTFAVGLLQNGVPLEHVAILLGNSVRIAEKHYAPWVQSRQEKLEEAVKRTWD